MKFTILTTATFMALASLSASQPLDNNPNVVPVRWNDVEAGVHAAQSSASVSAPIMARDATLAPANDVLAAQASARALMSAFYGGKLGAREAAPEPTPEPRRGKSGAEMGGYRGGSGLWGRSPEPKKKVDKKVEQTNVFDQGGDHKNDPSWG